jgi:glycosidase
LLYWSAKGVDGFRCDMAEMVPAEFWEWVIPCVKTHFPKVFFIAEIYKPELYERYLETGCFDYLYDKVRLYDTLVGIIKGHANADELTNCARSVERHPERMLFFLENHDEERIASFRFAGDPNKAIPGMVAGAALSCGPVMIYNGQECGETGDEIVGFAGSRGRTSIFDYTSMPEHLKWMNKGRFDGAKLSPETKKLRNFYVKLLNVINKSEAISSGKFYDLQYVNRHHLSEGFNEKYIYAYLRYTENERVLVICNFNTSEDYNVQVKIPQDAMKLMDIDHPASYTFYDLLNDEEIGECHSQEFTSLAEREKGVSIKMKNNAARIIRF